MSDTPETDEHDDQYHIGSYTLDFCRKLERERDEANRRNAELVRFNQPEIKHIGRWGHNKKEFTSPHINQ